MRVFAIVLALFCSTVLGQREAIDDSLPGDLNDRPVEKEAAASPEGSFDEEYTRLEREAMLPVFERSTPADAPWRAEARAFLERAAPALALAKVHTPWEELASEGKALIEAGCDDAMVLAVVALGLAEEDRGGGRGVAGTADWLERAAEALRETEYAAYRRGVVYRRLGEAHLEAGRDAAAMEAFHLAASDFVDAMTTPDLDRLHRTHILRAVAPLLYRSIPVEAGQHLVELAKAKREAEGAATDRWLLDILAGRLHVRLGWEARGTQAAREVTPEQWAGLHRHMDIARTHLEAAHTQDPELPHAATEMIAVARAGRAGRSTRYWFDRAIEAEHGGATWSSAYRSYMFSLRPRWGGSYEALIEFGKECLATGRFDTEVPWYLIEAVLMVCDDQGDFTTVFQDPEVYEACRRALLGLAEAQPSRRSHDLSVLVAMAWRAGRYEDAREVLDDPDHTSSNRALWLLRANWTEVWTDVYAYTGAQAELFRESMAAAEKGMWDRAAELCVQAIEGVEEPLERYALLIHAGLLRQKADFEAGEEVEFRFYHDDVRGWHPAQRRWDATRPAIRARTDWGRTHIICLLPVGNRFEIEGSLVTPRNEAGEHGAGAIFVGYDAEAPVRERWRAVVIRPSKQRIDVELGGASRFTIRVPAQLRPASNRFHIQAWDDRLIVRIRDDVVFDGEWPEYSIDWLPGDRMGAMALAPMDNLRGDEPIEIRFHQLRIRKLLEPLPPPGAVVEFDPDRPRRVRTFRRDRGEQDGGEVEEEGR